MSKTLWVFRSLVALLFVVLGMSIVGRGLLEGAPLTFTLMGILMFGLGLYRLKFAFGWGRQR